MDTVCATKAESDQWISFSLEGNVRIGVVTLIGSLKTEESLLMLRASISVVTKSGKQVKCGDLDLLPGTTINSQTFSVMCNLRGVIVMVFGSPQVLFSDIITCRQGDNFYDTSCRFANCSNSFYWPTHVPTLIISSRVHFKKSRNVAHLFSFFAQDEETDAAGYVYGEENYLFVGFNSTCGLQFPKNFLSFTRPVTSMEIHLSDMEIAIYVNDISATGSRLDFTCQRDSVARPDRISYYTVGLDLDVPVEYTTNILPRSWCSISDVKMSGNFAAIKSYENVHEARMACDDNPECQSIHNIGDGYRLRTGTTREFSKNSKSEVYCDVCPFYTMRFDEELIKANFDESPTNTDSAKCIDGDLNSICFDAVTQAKTLIITLPGQVQINEVVIIVNYDVPVDDIIEMVSTLSVKAVTMTTETSCNATLTPSRKQNRYEQMYRMRCNNIVASGVKIYSKKELRLLDVVICILRAKAIPTSSDKNLIDRTDKSTKTACTGKQQVSLTLEETHKVVMLNLVNNEDTDYLDTMTIKANDESNDEEVTCSTVTPRASKNRQIQSYTVSCNMAQADKIILSVQDKCIDIREIEVFVVGCERTIPPNAVLLDTVPKVVPSGGRVYVRCSASHRISPLDYNFVESFSFCVNGEVESEFSCENESQEELPIAATALQGTTANEIIDSDMQTFYLIEKTNSPRFTLTLNELNDYIITGVSIVGRSTDIFPECKEECALNKADLNVHLKWQPLGIIVDTCDVINPSFDLSTTEGQTYTSTCNERVNASSILLERTGSGELSAVEVRALVRQRSQFDDWKAVRLLSEYTWVDTADATVMFLSSRFTSSSFNLATVSFGDRSSKFLYDMQIDIGSQTVELSGCPASNFLRNLPRHNIQLWSVYKSTTSLLITCNGIPIYFYKYIDGGCLDLHSKPSEHIMFDPKIDQISEIYKFDAPCGSFPLKWQDYRGSASRSYTGRACKNWKVDKTYNYEEYAKYGFGDHRYCRNLDEDKEYPFCMVEDNDKNFIKEGCVVEECQFTEERSGLVVTFPRLRTEGYIQTAYRVDGASSITMCLKLKLETATGKDITLVSFLDENSEPQLSITIDATAQRIAVEIGTTKQASSNQYNLSTWNTLCVGVSETQITSVFNTLKDIDISINVPLNKIMSLSIGKCGNVDCLDVSWRIYSVYIWSGSLSEIEIKDLSQSDLCRQIDKLLLSKAVLKWEQICTNGNFKGDVRLYPIACRKDLRSKYCKYENEIEFANLLFENLDIGVNSLSHAKDLCESWNSATNLNVNDWCKFIDMKIGDADYIPGDAYEAEEAAKYACHLNPDCIGVDISLSGEYRLYKGVSDAGPQATVLQKCYFQQVQEQCSLIKSNSIKDPCGYSDITENDCFKLKCCYDKDSPVKCYNLPMCTGIGNDYKLYQGSAVESTTGGTFYRSVDFTLSGVCSNKLDTNYNSLSIAHSDQELSLTCSYRKREGFQFKTAHFEKNDEVIGETVKSEDDNENKVLLSYNILPPLVNNDRFKCVFYWENGGMLEAETVLKVFEVTKSLPDTVEDFPVFLDFKSPIPEFKLLWVTGRWPLEVLDISLKKDVEDENKYSVPIDVLRNKLSDDIIKYSNALTILLEDSDLQVKLQIGQMEMIVRRVRWDIDAVIHENNPTISCSALGPGFPHAVSIDGIESYDVVSAADKTSISIGPKCVAFMEAVSNLVKMVDCTQASGEQRFLKYDVSQKQFVHAATGIPLVAVGTSLQFTKTAVEYPEFDILLSGGIVHSSSRRPWVVVGENINLADESIDTADYSITDPFTLEISPLVIKFESSSVRNGSSIKCTANYGDVAYESSAILNIALISMSRDAIYTAPGNTAVMTCSVLDVTNVELKWYKQNPQTQTETLIEADNDARYDISQVHVDGVVTSKLTVLSASADEQNFDFKCKLSEDSYSEGVTTLKLLVLQKSLPRNTYWNRKVVLNTTAELQLSPDIPFSSITTSVDGSLTDSYVTATTHISEKRSNGDTQITATLMLKRYEDAKALPQPHELVLKITVTTDWGLVTPETTTTLYVFEMALNDNADDAAVVTGEPSSLKCTLSHSFPNSVASELINNINIRRLPLHSSVNDVGFILGRAGLSCTQTCEQDSGECMNDLITSDSTKLRGIHISADSVKTFLTSVTSCNFEPSLSTSNEPYYNPSTAKCVHEFETSDCDSTASDAQRVCICLGQTLAGTKTQSNDFTFSIEHTQIADSGNVRCSLIVDDKWFLTDNMRFMVLTYTHLPPSIIFVTEENRGFICEALVPVQGVNPSVTWDIGQVPGLTASLPGTRASFQIDINTFDVDGHVVTCEAVYLDGRYILPKKAFTLVKLSIFLTGAGSSLLVAKSQRALVSCTTTTSQPGVRGNLQLVHLPQEESYPPLAYHHYLYKKLNALDSTLKLEDRFNSYLSNNPLQANDYFIYYVSNIKYPLDLTFNSNKLKISLQKDAYFVDSEVSGEYPPYRVGQTEVKLEFYIYSETSLQIWVHGEPIKMISSSWLNERDAFMVLGGEVTIIEVYKPLDKVRYGANSIGNVASRLYQIPSMSILETGLYLCYSYDIIDDKVQTVSIDTLNLRVGDFTGEPVLAVPKTRGRRVNITTEAWYDTHSSSPTVQLYNTQSKTYVDTEYQIRTVRNGVLISSYYLPAATTGPIKALDYYSVILTYDNVYKPGNVSRILTVVGQVIKISSSKVLTFDRQLRTITCIAYGVPPGVKNPELLINGEVVTTGWTGEYFYEESNLYTTITFSGTRNTADSLSATYACRGTYYLSEASFIIEVSDDATEVVIRFKEPQRTAYDGVEGKNVRLTTELEIPGVSQHFTVYWIDNEKKEYPQSSYKVSSGKFESFFDVNFDFKKNYFAEVKLGKQSMQSTLQKPLKRLAAWYLDKIYILPLQTRQLIVNITSVSGPSSVTWFRNGLTLKENKYFVIRTSETTYEAFMLISFDNDKSDIVIDYSFEVNWGDGGRIESDSDSEVTKIYFIKDLPYDILAPVDFSLIESIEVKYDSKLKYTYSWIIKDTKGTYTATTKEKAKKKGFSKVTWNFPISDFWVNSFMACNIAITVKSTNEEMHMKSREASIHIQKISLFHRDIKLRPIPIVVEGKSLELTCTVASENLVTVTWVMEDLSIQTPKSKRTVSESSTEYFIDTTFTQESPGPFGVTTSKLRIRNAQQATVYSDLGCRINSRGNILSSALVEGHTNVYLLKVLTPLDEYAFVNEDNYYIFRIETTFIYDDNLIPSSNWFYVASGRTQGHFQDLGFGVKVEDTFPNVEITEYDKKALSKLSVPFEALVQYPFLEKAEVIAEIEFKYINDRKSFIVASPTKGMFHRQDTDCLNVVISKVIPSQHQVMTKLDLKSSFFTDGDIILLTVHRSLTLTETKNAVIELLLPSENNKSCPLLSIQLSSDVRMEHWLADSDGICRLISSLNTDFNINPGGITDLRILMKPGAFEFFKEVVDPSSVPFAVLPHEIDSKHGQIATITSVNSEAYEIIRISGCEMKRKVIFEEIPQIPDAYMVQLYWLGALGGLCYDDKRLLENDVVTICKDMGLNYGGELLDPYPTKDVQNIGHYWIKELNCDMDLDKSLYECKKIWLSFQESKNCQNAAVIKCYEAGFTNVRLRSNIEGVGSENDGLLEVLYNNEWRGVCGEFTPQDVTAACLSLNRSHGEVVDGSVYGPPEAKRKNYWQDKFQCEEGEESLFNCKTNIWGHARCSSGTAVALKCTPRLYCSYCKSQFPSSCFSRTNPIRETICHQDVKLCYRFNATFYDPTIERYNYTFELGCMPRVAPTCEAIKEAQIAEKAGKTLMFFYCRACSTNNCNRPALYKLTRNYINAFKGFFALDEGFLKFTQYAIRIFMFDASLISDTWEFTFNKTIANWIYPTEQ